MLITVLVVIIVVGVLLYLVETYLPMNATIKRIFEFIVILVLILWILKQFGLLAGVSL